MQLRPALAVAACALLAASPALAQKTDVQITGHVYKPTPKKPTPADVRALTLPDGFHVAPFAEDLDNPRIIAVADDGTVTYEERPAEELERLEALVRSAVGFDAERGDTVSVDSLRFIDYSLDVGAPLGMSVMQVVAANLMGILRSLFALALVALVLILG